MDTVGVRMAWYREVLRDKRTPPQSVRLHTGDSVRFGGRVLYYLAGDRLLELLGLRIVKQRQAE